MLGNQSIIGEGANGAPISSDAWKRAVYRAPPSHFAVEMLEPTKQGSDFSFGMRICPIRDDGRSISSRGSNSEYDIWRRWTDILNFQESLEVEYQRMSLAKKKRLARGKGIKKNGVYLKGDHAASFESLPPGPEAKSVSQNIHDYVPKMTKKGTLFRASQSTIDQRQRELEACINGLFADDVPALIQELRESRRVTDFFGYWRRDFDLAMKQQKARSAEKQPRHSISSSVFSTYFTASNASVDFSGLPASPPISPSSASIATSRARSSRTTTSTTPTMIATQFSASETLVNPALPVLCQDSSDEENYCRRGSDGSVGSSNGPPSPPGSSHGGPSPYIVSHDLPITFDHNPEHLQPFRKNSEFVGPLDGSPIDGDYPSPTRRERKTSAKNSDYRNAQIFAFEDVEEEEEEDESSKSMHRLSWQTTTSIATMNPATYLADLDTDLTLPKSPDSMSHFPRGSVASFATFMTDSSADAISPLASQANRRRSVSIDLGKMRPMSTHSSSSDQDDDEDLLDTYFNDAFGPTEDNYPDSRPETPVGELPSPFSAISTHFTRRPSTSRRSAGSDTSSIADSTISSAFSATSSAPSHTTARTSLSSDTSTGSTDGSLSVKIMHNDAIIILRVPRSTSFKEMRSKVYDKFVTQEAVPLSESFALAFIPATPMDLNKTRARSSSLSAATAPERVQMRFLHSEQDWESAVSSVGKTKMTLRAIGHRGD